MMDYLWPESAPKKCLSQEHWSPWRCTVHCPQQSRSVCPDQRTRNRWTFWNGILEKKKNPNDKKLSKKNFGLKSIIGFLQSPKKTYRYAGAGRRKTIPKNNARIVKIISQKSFSVMKQENVGRLQIFTHNLHSRVIRWTDGAFQMDALAWKINEEGRYTYYVRRWY